MNTNDLIKKCIELPGLSLKKNESCIELCMEQGDGKGSMTFFPLFPGISLAYVFINSPTWPMPDLSRSDTSSIQITLNYCISGRCELLINNSSYAYLKDGELSIAKRSFTEQYRYPLRIYEGLEFLIDIDTINEEAEYIKEVFHIDIYKFINLYSLLDKTYISICTEEAKDILFNIWKLYDEEPTYALFMMQLYTLELLEILSCKKHALQPKPSTYFTATQVAIAQKTEHIITSDLKHNHPAWELAEMFSISETSLKNYFRGIFGQNISVYLREARMNAAAKMLEKTKLPISKISEQVGYMNQSKFASVFKNQYHMSPLEYRRKKVLEQV